RLIALDPLSEFGQRALMRAYAHAGRRGEALRQYQSCAEIMKRRLGVAPDAETQVLANEIARSIGAGELDAPKGVVEDRNAATLRNVPDRSPEGQGAERLAVPASALAKPRWPCSLPKIAVAVAPLRNFAADPDQRHLAEAFTDDLVTDLLRHGRGLSLKPIADEQRPPGKLTRASERGLEYVVT